MFIRAFVVPSLATARVGLAVGSQCSKWLAYKALVTAIEIHLQILSANYEAYTAFPKHRKELAVGQKPKIDIYKPYGFL